MYEYDDITFDQLIKTLKLFINWLNIHKLRISLQNFNIIYRHIDTILHNAICFNNTKYDNIIQLNYIIKNQFELDKIENISNVYYELNLKNTKNPGSIINLSKFKQERVYGHKIFEYCMKTQLIEKVSFKSSMFNDPYFTIESQRSEKTDLHYYEKNKVIKKLYTKLNHIKNLTKDIIEWI